MSTVVGYTQAYKVIALVNCSDVALLMVTRAFVPLKFKALPYLPEVVHVAPLMVPLCPLPVAQLSPPIAINVPGELWLLYSVATQLALRSIVDSRTSSSVPASFSALAARDMR